MKGSMAIEQLNQAEKLPVMETIWEDLSREDQPLQSPARHESLLQKTEQRVQSGQEKILHWKEAKKELRKRFE